MSTTRHFLLVAIPAWGHLRPLCVLAGRLAKEGILITISTTPNFLDKAVAEVTAQFSEGTADEAFTRIRVVSLVSLKDAPQDPFKLLAVYCEATGPLYQTLYNGEPIQCQVSQKTYDGPALSALIVDFFSYFTFAAAREINAKASRKVPIISWLTGGASMTLRILGPPSLGGIGIFGPGGLMETESARLGRPPFDVADELLSNPTGAVVNLPGVPPMYDYGFYPQALPFKMPIAALFDGAQRVLAGCDGSLICTNDTYEGESLAAFRGWTKNILNSPTWAIGPVLPAGYATSSLGATGQEPFSTFLDDKLAKFGERSVLYMSFGTMFWPQNTHYIEVVIDTLIEKKFPFLFTTASPFANITPEVEERIKSSGIGMLVKWSPQQYILNHPATGWFMSHCGHGSVTESLASGVPLICWPFEADQPTGALNITKNLGVGIELLQVRSGEHGLKPLHPSHSTTTIKGTVEAVREEISQVIDAIQGDEGKKIRANTERLKGAFAQAWEKGGSSESEFGEFLKFVQ